MLIRIERARMRLGRRRHFWPSKSGSSAIDRRSRHTQRATGGTQIEIRCFVLGSGHQSLSGSSSESSIAGSAIPSIRDTFFWRSIISSALCSFF